jgi:CubicO group peptidase (beta-lactamase class C family)
VAPAAFDDLLARWQRQFLVPAAGVVVVDAHGVRGVGDDEGVFDVASLAKSITAWLVLELAARRVVDIDVPVNRYLAQWKLQFADGAPCDATLRQLLDHTAGLPSGMPTCYQRLDAVPDIETSLRVESVTARTQPGSHFAYSNAGYAVVQAAVERATTSSFNAVAHELVLSRLGMTRSSFDWSDVAQSSRQPHRATGYPATRQFSPWRAAGGLYSSAADLGRFVSALLAAGRRDDARGPVSSRGLNEVLTTSAAGLAAFHLRRGGYGLGHAWGRDTQGRMVIGNQGSNQGWKSLFLALPALDRALVVVTNSNSGELLSAEAAIWWLAQSGLSNRPQRVLTAARIGIAAVSAAVLLRGARGAFQPDSRGRWFKATLVAALLAAVNDRRTLDRALLGPIPLGRLVHTRFPELANAAALGAALHRLTSVTSSR